MAKSKLTLFKEKIQNGGLGDPKLFSEITDYIRMQTKLLEGQNKPDPAQALIIEAARNEASGLLIGWPKGYNKERQ